MSEELCLWIGQELDEKKIWHSRCAVFLLGNGSLSDFTELILRSCGYCSEDTIHHIRSVCCWICRINLYLNVRRSGQTVTWRVKSM